MTMNRLNSITRDVDMKLAGTESRLTAYVNDSTSAVASEIRGGFHSSNQRLSDEMAATRSHSSAIGGDMVSKMDAHRDAIILQLTAQMANLRYDIRNVTLNSHRKQADHSQEGNGTSTPQAGALSHVPAEAQQTDLKKSTLRVPDRTSDFLKSVLLVACGMLYARPESRQLFQRLIQHQSLDPFLVTIYALFALYMAKCFQSLPQRLSLFSGDTISFEDALGTSVEVPYSTYRHIKIFRAFLEVHFEGKPGFQKVLDGQYQLLHQGRFKASEVSQKSWDVTTWKKSKLVMNMLFAAYDTICVDCFEPLATADNGYHWYVAYSAYIRRPLIHASISCDHDYRKVNTTHEYLPTDIVSAINKNLALSTIVLYDFRGLGTAVPDVATFDASPQRSQSSESGKSLPFKHMSLVKLNEWPSWKMDRVHSSSSSADEPDDYFHPVPLAKACGAQWSRNGTLVAFFPLRLPYRTRNFSSRTI